MTIAPNTDITGLLNARQYETPQDYNWVAESIEQLRRQQASINGAVEIIDVAAQTTSTDQRPFSGIPFSVKETIGLAGHSITAGSLRMPPITVSENAPVVQALLDKGAVVTARSNLPEFAMCYDSENLRFGRTNNPLNPLFSAGGSSGGEAALVASGATLFGIGSDIGGSIRYPAHCCGVVGFKPSSNAVSKQGTFPQLDGSFCDSMLAIGPLTRSVRDAQLIYDVIANKPVTSLNRLKLRVLKPDNWPIKIQHENISRALEASCNSLSGAGYEKETTLNLSIKALYHAYLQLIVHEFLPLMRNALTNQHGERYRSSRELINQISGRPQVHPYVFWPLLLMPIIKPSPAKVRQLKALVESARKQVREFLQKDCVLLLPTNGALAMQHGKATWKINRPWVQKEFIPTILMNLLDLPAISVPAKRFSDQNTGLIPGIMLACAPGAEDLLFSSARLIESRLNRKNERDE